MIRKRCLPNIDSVRTGTHTWRRMTMNTTAISVDEQPHFAGSEERNDELREMNALWHPEELAEPDVWTLASFGDVLPHEVA